MTVVDPFLGANKRGGGGGGKSTRGGGSLRDRLALDYNGAVVPNLNNALLILVHDPELKEIVAFNEFTATLLAMRSPPPLEQGQDLSPGPYPRALADEDVALIQAYIQRIYMQRLSAATARQAVVTAATLTRLHPVREWLGSLSWDGTDRIDKWMIRAFGAADDPYHRAVAAKTLIAAVRRIRTPGAKFDSMLVLEGRQDIGKSRACRTLAGPEWFADTIPNDLTSRDAAHSLAGLWIVEWAEIEHLIRTEPETVKAFLSRQVDRYRKPYGHGFIDWPRQCVFIGTTNSADYLRDVTGNRRIWPVRCEHADVQWIEETRDQLWAEAAARERAGEELWLDLPEAREGAQQAQEARMSEDVWTDRAREFLAVTTSCRTAELLAHIGVPIERQGKREEMRAAAILTREGWQRTSEWVNGKTVRTWRLKPEK